MGYQEANLSIDDLIFDPNNYRFQDVKGFFSAAPGRFHETTVQERAYKALKESSNVEQLRASIVANGFIPVEKLVVRQYDHKPGTYIVIEGNRRLAALRWIEEAYHAGVKTSEGTLAILSTVPVVIVEGEETDLTYKAIMGIRHVSGISQWGGYQRAKLVVELKDDFDLGSSEVAERLGMTAHEVNRRFRAFKALAQMKDNDEFGEYALPELYPIFHEAVSLPAVKEWLKWDEASASFTEPDELIKFYSLLVPVHEEEYEAGESKITTYSQVRELRSILANEEARTLLFDPDKSFFDALSEAKRKEVAKSWLVQVGSAITALESVTIKDLITLEEGQRQQIGKLRDLAAEILENYEKLKK